MLRCQISSNALALSISNMCHVSVSLDVLFHVIRGGNSRVDGRGLRTGPGWCAPASITYLDQTQCRNPAHPLGHVMACPTTPVKAEITLRQVTMAAGPAITHSSPDHHWRRADTCPTRSRVVGSTFARVNIRNHNFIGVQVTVVIPNLKSGMGSEVQMVKKKYFLHESTM